MQSNKFQNINIQSQNTNIQSNKSQNTNIQSNKSQNTNIQSNKSQNTNMQSNKFQITNFTPVGYLKAIYPVSFCALCRGNIGEPCAKCMVTDTLKCDVVSVDNNYYHGHCLSLKKQMLVNKNVS